MADQPAPSPIDPDEFELRKRLPPRFSRQPNDVYLTQRTNFKAQLGRCLRLLEEKGFQELTLHGLGPAINRASNLALQLKRRGLGSLQIEVNTATLHLTDDLLPLIDDAEQTVQRRPVSAIHIRVFKSHTPVTDY